jgi:Na+-transporting methylmalonyl-CoA/oxaloacetate decarboxylase gamma subunit
MNNTLSSKEIIKVFIFLSILIFTSSCIAESQVTKTEKNLLKIQKEINQLNQNIKKILKLKKIYRPS